MQPRSESADITRAYLDLLSPAPPEAKVTPPPAASPATPRTLIAENCKCPKCSRLGLSVWDDGSHECRFKTCRYLQVWSRLKPPREIIQEVDPDYDTEIYRKEITKALAHVRGNLTRDEGRKDFEDLTQIVDFEIWKATKRYGDKMNEKLAYTIAENQAQRFLKKLTEEPAGFQDFPKDAEGNALPANRLSFQDQKPDEGGEELAESEAEIAVANAYPTPDEEPDYATEFGTHRPALEQLVKSWYGNKRLVGEAILSGTAAVRDIPGVPKSTAARVRKVVLEEFKSLIRRGL